MPADDTHHRPRRGHGQGHHLRHRAGLPPETLSRIFDPFFTTKPDGLGIGLSITRTIIELHRGQLWVEPGDGRGCTFAFTLPAALEDATTSR